MIRHPGGAASAPPSSVPRRIGRRALLTLAAALLCACAAPGRDRFMPADSSVDPYASVRAQADEHYRQGLDYFRTGEHRKALESFRQAKLHDPNPRPEIDEMIRRTQEALASGQASAAPAAPTPPPATGRTFISRAYNYVVTYPEGWKAEGATTRVGSTLLDLYAEEQGAASAFVFGFPSPADASQDALVRQSLALRQKTGTAYKRVGVRPVDEAQAVVVSYSEQRADGVWLAVRQAIFQRGGSCWVVAVAAPANDATRYGGVLDQMLDGFRVSASRA
jgi:hypothetical protein